MKVSFNKVSFWLINLVLVALMLLIISLVLLASKTNPLTFLDIIFIEPWKDLSFFSGFLNIFSILLLVSLAVAVTFRYKIYNFGVAGQMLFSAMVTFVVGSAISDAGGKNRSIVIFLLLITLLVGALSGFLISVLKNYFKVNEIISTILFNFIAWQGYKGLLASNFYKGKPISPIFSLRFSLGSSPFDSNNLFSAGIILAVIVLIIVILFFSNRMLDFKLNVFSKNPAVARQAKVKQKPENFKIWAISGAIAGLAGYLVFLANTNHLPELTGIPQEGFYAVAIAALVFYQVVLIPVSAFMFTLLIRPIEFNSFAHLNNSGLAIIILGIAVYLMGLFPFVCYIWQESPKIQETWLKVKRKLFKIATPIETELGEIDKKKPVQVIETLKIDLESKKEIKQKQKLKNQNKENDVTEEKKEEQDKAKRE